MNKVKYIFIILLLIKIFYSCNSSLNNNTTAADFYLLQGEAQGTTYNIKFQTTDTTGIKKGISAIFNEMDYNFSHYIDNSFITYINNTSRSGEQLSYNLTGKKHFLNLINQSKQIEQLTQGAFNPMVMPLVKYWGFGKERKHPDEADSVKINNILKLLDFNSVQINCHDDSCMLTISKNQQFDFNAIAQGYTVDCIADFFDSRNIENYMIELGGEVRCKGKNPDNKIWTIGIDKPIDSTETRELQAKIILNNLSLATSGNYRKFYVKDGIKYSHTINPKTGYPVQHNLLSATVVANSCAKADAYATAFMVMGKEKTIEFLHNHPEEKLDIYLICTDRKGSYITYMSEGIYKILEEF